MEYTLRLWTKTLAKIKFLIEKVSIFNWRENAKIGALHDIMVEEVLLMNYAFNCKNVNQTVSGMVKVSC